MFCVGDFEAQAQKILKKDVYDLFASGANEELTLRDNTKAFARSYYIIMMLASYIV